MALSFHHIQFFQSLAERCHDGGKVTYLFHLMQIRFDSAHLNVTTQTQTQVRGVEEDVLSRGCVQQAASSCVAMFGSIVTEMLRFST